MTSYDKFDDQTFIGHLTNFITQFDLEIIPAETYEFLTEIDYLSEITNVIEK